MKSAEFPRIKEIRCDTCGQITPSYDIISYGSMECGYRELCSQCFNMEVAKLGGLDTFEHPKFEPIGLADCTGKVHEFHFRTRLLGTGVSLDAFELRVVIRLVTSSRSSVIRKAICSRCLGA